MLGFIDYDHPDGGTTRAVLEDDGTWTSQDDPEAVSYLETLFPCEFGPQHGRPGAKALSAAAKFLQGTAHMPYLDPPPGGGGGSRVY